MASAISLLAFSGEIVSAEARAMHGGISAPGGGGAITTLTPWTITEQSGVGQTNVPIEIWVPFSAVTDPATGSPGPNPFSSTDALYLVDADGSTVIPCQEDNRVSDLTPDVRGVRLTAILPSLTANQARQLTVKKISSTAAATGTDVTAAEIIATGFDCSLAITLDYAGTVYTASAATALAAGAWSNKNAAANLGKWFTGGGLVTQFVCYCPFKNAGSVTQDNIGAWFCVSAFKSGRGAVSGGNPIIGVKVQYWTEVGWVGTTPSSAHDHSYDMAVTCGTNTKSWTATTPAPAQTLTLSNNGSYLSGNNYANATVPSGGNFTADLLGGAISDGTGEARIVSITNANSAVVFIGNPFASTTTPSGNWKIRKCGQAYAGCFPMQEIWYGGSPTITTKPLLDSTLGVAWNGGTQTGGCFSYFKANKLTLPYTTPASAVTNDVTRLNSQGTTPTGYDTFVGDMYAYMGTTGPRSELAPTPGFFVDAMIRPDANSKRKIFENATKFSLFPMHWRDQTTGKTTLMNTGTDYFSDSNFGSPVLPQTGFNTSTNRMNFLVPQMAHHPITQHVPYYYTGDFYWVDKMQQQLFWLWSTTPSYFGSQFNRVTSICDEQRGNGWNRRDMFIGLFMIPDRNPSVLGWSRSHLRSWIDAQYTAVNSGVPGVNPRPGINITCVNNTGPGKTFATSGIRDTSHVGGGFHGNWQLGMGLIADFQSWGLGILTPDAKAFITWYSEGVTGIATSPDVVPNWFVPTPYISTSLPDASVDQSWAGAYRRTAIEWDAQGNGSARRIVTGAGMTLSATSGAAITVTLPPGYVSGGGTAFYAQGLVRDWSALSLCITPAIIGGGTGYAVGDTVALSVTGLGGTKTQTTAAVLTVASISGGGGTGPITGVTVSNRGVFTNSGGVGDWTGLGIFFTQASTSGAGTGATFGGNTATDSGEGQLLRYGTAQIVSVAGDQLTLTTNATNGSFPLGTVNYYPFARVSLATNLLQIPAPAPGGVDGDGPNLGVNDYLPHPHTTFYDYYDIAQSAIWMCDLYGMPNGAAAKTWITTNYTGGNDSKWKVN